MYARKRFLPAIPLLALLLACRDPLDPDPSFVGVIQEIVETNDRRLQFDADVEQRIRQRSFSTRVDVFNDIPILVEEPDRSLLIGWRGDLAVGSRVRVWRRRSTFLSPIPPPTVVALRIEVLRHEPGQ